jgi:alcohol dehydrogenase class IV
MLHNRPTIERAMDRLARFLELPRPGLDGVLQWMLELRAELGLPHTLEGVPGFDEEMAKALAPLAAVDPSLSTNPKPCTLEELETVFLKAWRGEL